MKERIREMIDLIDSGKYDQEQTHMEYDVLLEDFINNINQQDEFVIVLMKSLISRTKDFWYA